MAIYEYSVASPAAAPAAGYADMLAGTSDCFVREIHIFAQAATASQVTLFRTTAAGTRTTPVVPTAAQCARSGTGNNPLAGFATAWSVAPTLATNPMRKFQCGAAAGSGVIWTFYNGDGLRVPSGSSIVLNNTGAATASICLVTFVWEE